MNLHEKLLAIGLSVYEAKAYEVLLSNGLLTASKISELADIPQGRIYSVLKSLEKRSFCTVYSGSVKKFDAVSPKITFQSVLQDKEDEIKKVKQLGVELEGMFEKRQSEGSPQDFIQILTSKQSQISKFDELIKASNISLFSFNKRPYATGFLRNMDDIIKSSIPLKKALERGVKIKALFEMETEHVEEFSRMVQYYKDIGEEVRVCQSLPMKMLLSDNSSAMVSMRSQDNAFFNLTSMVVDHSDLSIALNELFELYWSKGMKIDEYIGLMLKKE